METIEELPTVDDCVWELIETLIDTLMVRGAISPAEIEAILRDTRGRFLAAGSPHSVERLTELEVYMLKRV